MKRFQIATLIAVILCAIAAMEKQFLFVAVVIGAFLIVTGFGIAIPQLRFFGDFICRGSKSKKQVALTFDDGPDPRSTPQLLDLLRSENVPAAFFCIGKQVEENASLALRIVLENHLLENHSFNHSNFTNFYSESRLQKELQQTQAVIQKTTRVAPKYFRPPVGLSNPNTFHVAEKMNLKVIGWSVRSLDTVSRNPKKIVSRIIRKLKPGGIVLLHDGKIPADRLVATVKSLLDELQKLNYEVVRLDELLK